MTRLLALAVLLTGCAAPGTRQAAYQSHGADLASTGVGLSIGAIEANPLGVIGIPIKIAITEHIKTLPKDEQPQAYAALSAITWGAVANNICVIASIATAGAFSPVCPVIGPCDRPRLLGRGERQAAALDGVLRALVRPGRRVPGIHLHPEPEVAAGRIDAGKNLRAALWS